MKMTTTDRLAQLIKKLNKSWRKDAKKAVAYFQALLAQGMKAEAALAKVQRHYGKLFTLPELQPALVEAAAYAYGIVPSVLSVAQAKLMGEQLSAAWDASGMKLSEKLHGASQKMRESIIGTLREQMRHNKTWQQAARALYDGYADGKNDYTGGVDIIRRQEIAHYMQAVRRATAGDAEALRAQLRALDNINSLARRGAPNKALQAAYNELLAKVQQGKEKQIARAVEVAINEKSRYVAERIMRTEMARAWADGFWAKVQDDDDVVAVKFKLSSRHPVFDICDMYAKADMFGLGAGVFPKDKVPALPVHPHCLCRYAEVIYGEVDMKQQRRQVRAAGDKWLNSIPESRKVQVLGRDGLKAWKDGEDWRKYMRGYAGLREAESRLQMYKPVELSGKALTDKYQSPKGTIKEFQTRKVENAAYDIHVSENVNLKPKMLAEANRQINKCIGLLDVRNKEELPKIVIASNDDLTNALGSYVACENKLYINSEILHRKAYEKYLATLKNPASRNPLMTMLHEMIHWQDARRYVAEFGEITQQDEYMAYIIEMHRGFVDKLVNKRYNFVEISDYASKMYIGDRYDEVMTEYRVKKLLG